jgi:ubiquinone/menaquinone biosynthesis C-methylase UbiE
MTEESSSRGVKEFYDRWSPKYDEDQERSPYLSYLSRRYLELLGAHLGYLLNPTLDLGCGTGAQTLFMLKMGREVLSLDLSLGSLRVLKSKLGPLEAFCHVVNADAAHLPLRASCISSAYCLGYILGHFKAWPRALAELSRALKHEAHALLEFENAYRLELVYYVLDVLLRGRLGSTMGSRRQLMGLLGQGTYIWHAHSFGNPLSIRFYAVRPWRIRPLLHKMGLQCVGDYGAYIAQQLFPVWLGGREDGSRIKALLNRVLSYLDRALYGAPLLRRLGFSYFVLAKKA